MKNLITIKSIIYFIAIFAFFNSSCIKELDIVPASLVDENGLTKGITDLVPQEILDEMIALGLPINGGANPPILNETYNAAPFILISSNRPGDYAGMAFASYQVTFSGQNNDDLTIKVDYVNGPESGNGIGSFIVGEGCSFSVFVEVNSMYSGTEARLVHVISGNLVNRGIEDLHFANFMIDNNGNPSGLWIENGEGRVVHDQDGFSEKLGVVPSWYSGLPDCPCEYSTDIDGREEMCGVWVNCGGASQEYHYGATWEIRWAPNESGNAGQQCTYNNKMELITAGIAAGSPDKISPRSCSSITTSTAGHYLEDVVPWENNLIAENKTCWEYLNEWPSNNKNACSENRVTDIQHMLNLVGTMTCEEVTTLFKTIDSNFSTSHNLRKFFHQPLTSYDAAKIVDDFKELLLSLACADDFFTSDECKVIQKAIDNLE